MPALLYRLRNAYYKIKTVRGFTSRLASIASLTFADVNLRTAGDFRTRRLGDGLYFVLLFNCCQCDHSIQCTLTADREQSPAGHGRFQTRPSPCANNFLYTAEVNERDTDWLDVSGDFMLWAEQRHFDCHQE